MLIVEDDCLIALDVEAALVAAGFEVCGMAVSQEEALEMAMALHPDFAVVDISLSPGDGRVVARELTRMHTAVLFATGQCDEVKTMTGTGAVACLPKPYDANDVPQALRVVSNIVHGDPPGPAPGHMFRLVAQRALADPGEAA